MTQQYLKICNHSLAQGKYTEAKTGFYFILMDNPRSTEAYRGISYCEIGLKNWPKAIEAHLNTLICSDNKTEDLELLLTTLETSQLATFIPELIKPLSLAMESRLLEKRAINQLWQQLWDKNKTIFLRTTFIFDSEVTQLLKDNIFCRLIARSLKSDYQVENFLLCCRQELLHKALSGDNIQPYLPFLSSFACLMLLNDSLYMTSDQDKALIEEIQLNNLDVDSLLLLFCFANLPTAMALWAENKNLLLSDEFKELNEDLSFYSEVFSSEDIFVMENKVSNIVQSFYMDNPYPKWKSTKVGSIDITKFELKSELSFSSSSHVLFAGCGTGQQIISFAISNPKVNITAIDLSPYSLNFARLMSKKFNIKNVYFKVLDILDINKLEKSFDLIVCTGVLHHMAVPQDGLVALEKVLNPNGTMFLAYYSQAARVPLSDIKKDILTSLAVTEEKITKDDLRKWRASLNANQKDSLLYNLGDFFYLNGLYDLLFHPQQSEYNLLDLNEMLKHCGLKFEVMNQEPISKELNDKINNFNKPTTTLKTINFWHRFELENPSTFKNMYQFFVSKIN